MFAFVSQWFGESLDKVLAPIVGDSYGKVMGALGAVLIAAAAVIGLSVAVAWSGRQIDTPPYFIVRPGQAPERLPVLASPSLSATKIVNWSGRALRDIFHLEFGKVDQQLSASSVYFAPDSWTDFRAAMDKTEMVERIKRERLFVILTPLEDPQLLKRAIVGNQEVLVVEAPVVLTYIGAEKPVYQYQMIELYIRAVPSTEDPEGLAIIKLSAHPYR